MVLAISIWESIEKIFKAICRKQTLTSYFIILIQIYSNLILHKVNINDRKLKVQISFLNKFVDSWAEISVNYSFWLHIPKPDIWKSHNEFWLVVTIRNLYGLRKYTIIYKFVIKPYIVTNNGLIKLYKW